jgi:hypothetical protein
MELTKYAQAIKNELCMELAKQGSSIEEFEKTLENINTGEGVYKFAQETFEIIKQSAAKAEQEQGGLMSSRGLSTLGGALGGTLGFVGGGPLGGVAGAAVGGTAGNLLGTVPEAMELGLKGSVGGGALAGLGLDEMDKSVEVMNKALERERDKLNLVRRITQNLRKEHGLI